jgi:hypothetical protein
MIVHQSIMGPTPGHLSTDGLTARREPARRHVKEEAMRNEAMQQLDVLVGSWGTTMLNAWFLEPAGRKVTGSAIGEWLDDAFVVFAWTMVGDVGKATSKMVLVLGRCDAHDAYTALYHDERSVCRVFAMTFDGSHWNLSREDRDMFQRGSSLTSTPTGSQVAGRRPMITDQRGARTSTSSSSGRKQRRPRPSTGHHVPAPRIRQHELASAARRAAPTAA